MHQYIADDIRISSDSVREDSDEENSDEENSRKIKHTMWIKRLLLSCTKQFIKHSNIKYFLQFFLNIKNNTKKDSKKKHARIIKIFLKKKKKKDGPKSYQNIYEEQKHKLLKYMRS